MAERDDAIGRVQFEANALLELLPVKNAEVFNAVMASVDPEHDERVQRLVDQLTNLRGSCDHALNLIREMEASK
ncbi:hypothetical protein QP179_09840 [Sphingomonas aurantiaca]|uniref:hypothetical protein n=1 Tax=Sphingomonas aurantiaca TaxID=185949 RepID=UPI002FDF27CA